VNTAISYYTKGEIAGFLLDARIRHATNGTKSLDDAMRLAYQRYSGARGYTAAEFRQAAEEVAGVPLAAWFHTALESTEELDYSEALNWFGLRFKPDEPPKPDAPPRVEKAWTGLTTSVVNNRLVVTEVRRETPGYEAGFNVQDEILGIDDYRVRPDQLAARLEFYRPGDAVSILIARRDQLMRIETTLGAEPRPVWKLEVDPKATDDQKAHLKAWLERAL
jgi:predicted metalloprotease with PDZ domain